MYQDYNFWADLLTTYRSNPDWLKFLWVFIPAAILVLTGNTLARLIRHAIGSPQPSPPPPPPPAAAAAPRYRGMMGPQGELYLETVPDEERGVLPDMRRVEDR